MKIKVLHTITGLNVGGAERFLSNLLSGRFNSEFDSGVVSLLDGGYFGEVIKANKVPVWNLGLKSKRISMGSIFRYMDIVRKFRPNIIQGWMYHGNLVTILKNFCVNSPLKIFWSVHHSLSDIQNEKPSMRKIIKLNKLCSKMPQKIVYVSNISRIQHEKFGFDSKKSTVIPLGFDLVAFKKRYKNISFRADLSIPENSIVVGHVARFHPMKNHFGFVEMAKKIVSKNANVYFILCGREITSSNTRLLSLIPPSLSNHFRFLGERNDIADIMKSFDIFCSSSSYGEAFPNVLGEAMASGVPCVTTDVGDCSFIVGESGIVVSPNHIDSLRAGIDSLLKLEKAERKALGERGRIRIETNFSLNIIQDQYMRLYHG